MYVLDTKEQSVGVKSYFERFKKSLPIFNLLCKNCHFLKQQMKEENTGL